MFLVLGTGPGERKRGRRARVGLSVLGWPLLSLYPAGSSRLAPFSKRLQAAAAGAVAVVSAQCVSEEVSSSVAEQALQVTLRTMCFNHG